MYKVRRSRSSSICFYILAARANRTAMSNPAVGRTLLAEEAAVAAGGGMVLVKTTTGVL